MSFIIFSNNQRHLKYKLSCQDSPSSVLIFAITPVTFAAEARLWRELLSRRPLTAVAVSPMSLRRQKPLSRWSVPLRQESLSWRPIAFAADPAVRRRLPGFVARLNPDRVGVRELAWSGIMPTIHFRTVHMITVNRPAVIVVIFLPAMIRHFNYCLSLTMSVRWKQFDVGAMIALV